MIKNCCDINYLDIPLAKFERDAIENKSYWHLNLGAEHK